MSTKSKPKKLLAPAEEPNYGTFVRDAAPSGVVVPFRGGWWLYRQVPLGIVDDATSASKSTLPGDVLTEAFMAVRKDLTPRFEFRRRSFDHKKYREVHLLLVNVPQLWRPRGELGGYWGTAFPNAVVMRRVLLFGVRLVPSMTDRGWREAVRSAVDSVATQQVPASDYEGDIARVRRVLTRAGLVEPRPEDFALASAWWNLGGKPKLPYLVHDDHLHMFANRPAARSAQALQGDGVDCAEWPDTPQRVEMSFSTVAGTSFGFNDSTDINSRWVSSLVRSNAACISIRGLIEPEDVTTEEIARTRRGLTGDINSGVTTARSDRAEQVQGLQQVEDEYRRGGMPTLTDCRTIVVFAGRDEMHGFDPAPMGDAAGVTLLPVDEQDLALMETMIGSPVRVTPYRRDLPVQTVAYSGIAGLSTVGDDPRTSSQAALLGFTERDRQPAYIGAMASIQGGSEASPTMFVAGALGSGKTAIMAWLADQWARTTTQTGLRTPIVIFDPKQGSNLSRVVSRTGGTTVWLDDLASADGVLDPLRFSRSTEDGVELALTQLETINPWEGAQIPSLSARLARAVRYGVEHGAQATLQALEIAERDLDGLTDIVQPVRDLLQGYPQFAALCGSNPQGPRLSVADGITYIAVGEATLNLPPETLPATSWKMGHRITAALVRAVSYGAMAAMRGRHGVLLQDEAWTITSIGPDEVERVGRMARSWKVMPVLFSQRVTDALNIGLDNYISRGLILPIDKESEAVSACLLFGLDPTPERIARITAKATIGGEHGAAPDWSSMRHLYKVDPANGARRSVRGTIAIYCDLSGRAVPVEVSLPPSFVADLR